jgi:4-diphosphocytidyl-2-C-methyl-D-erythritol kinase
MNELAPAKVNLCLFLGAVRSDDRHELVTLFESITLADELTLTVLPEGPDDVVCPGVVGPNLVSAALSELRDRGWAAPPVRIEIRKRIPVAAGLGGGSADAAGALRLAQAVAPVGEGLAQEIAARLGADVPSQLQPGLALGTGAGDEVQTLEALGPHAFVIVPQPFPLATADVYREADLVRLPRPAEELEERRRCILATARPGAVLPAELLVNDLQPAALSLAPTLAQTFEAVGATAPDQLLLCGSGPTVAGIFWGVNAEQRAVQAAEDILPTHPGATAAVPFVQAPPELAPQ